MPRTEILSPAFSTPGHRYTKMPELYSTKSRSTYGYSTSYDSYGGSSSRRSSLLNGSASGSATSSSRPLPVGPGPLDSTGRRLSNYSHGSASSSSYKPRTSSHSITSKTSQPMKVEYGRTRDYSPSSYSPSSRFRNEPDHVYRPSSGNLRTRRSSSLINLTADLSLDENKSTARRDSILSTTSNSRTSSRATLYDTGQDTDNVGRSSRVSRACTVDREDYSRNMLSNRSSSVLREPGYTSLSQRRQSVERDSPAKSLSRQSSNGSIVTGGSGSKYSSGGKVGLRNLGNTCFMNSVLQSLSNTKPLLEYCLNEDYVLDSSKTSSMKGALMSAYANLMHSLWKNKHESFISPNLFKTQIQKFAPRFMGYLQQDAQEFLRYLLQGLHEDVNRVVGKPKPIVLKDSDLERKSDAENAHEYWRAYVALDNSKIVEIFVGQLKSELKFTDCGHRSVTFDPFWDLSLPIAKNRSEVSIQDCISLFMKEEVLGEDERPKCAKCKSRRSCTKSFSIQKFPKILVLHFKRFSQERYSRKVNTSVDYPVNNLDLTEFSAEKGGGKVLYNLYAVSCHSGSTHGGHYTAFCKHPYNGEWNSFNDTRVSGARSNQAVTSDAYVLFYELVSHPSRL